MRNKTSRAKNNLVQPTSTIVSLEMLYIKQAIYTVMSLARRTVLYNRQGQRVDCRGQGRPLLPGVRGLRMRQPTFRNQDPVFQHNTTRDCGTERERRGDRRRGTTPRTYNHGTRVRLSVRSSHAICHLLRSQHSKSTVFRPLKSLQGVF